MAHASAYYVTSITLYSIDGSIAALTCSCISVTDSEYLVSCDDNPCHRGKARLHGVLTVLFVRGVGGKVWLRTCGYKFRAPTSTRGVNRHLT